MRSTMIQQRLPQLAEQFVTALSGDPVGAGRLGELWDAATSLDVDRPTWTDLSLGKRPLVPWDKCKDNTSKTRFRSVNSYKEL